MQVTWYFDFVSPFAYLQFERLRAASVAFVPRPIVLARVLEAHGQLGPAEIPSKREFTYRHVTWLAAQAGVPLRFPAAGHPFNSIPLLRPALAHDGDLAVVARLFRYVWVEGSLPQQPEPWRALLSELGVEDRDASEAVKLALREETERAIALGVFGVPTARVDGQSFWGLDATGMLLDCVRDPAGFAATPWGAPLDVLVAARRARVR